MMPSERWKTLPIIVTTVFLCRLMGQADGTEGMQHPISMGADGWKPILGSNRSPTTHYQDEIKYYQNPILKETVKAEPLPTTTPIPLVNATRFDQKSLKTIAINVVHHPGYSKGKVPPHSKHGPQYFVLPNHGSHGPHIPLNTVIHRNPNHHKKMPSKNHGHNNGKRVKKPGYGQLVTAHSTRNEVYVPAPSPGSYSFFSQGKNVKIRESAGLANDGQKIFSVQHPNMEISSHFPPNNLYQPMNQPIQHIIFQKQQVNEIIPAYQVDTLQNLSPPPIFKNFGEINQVQPSINPEIRTPDDKVILQHNPLGPNDLILQLPTYDPNLFTFGKQKVQNSNVQMTRENIQPLQKYPMHNLVQVEGEFGQINHIPRRPVTEYPKVPTYEVTEGKWEENTASVGHRMPNVELDVPPFLPTPYRPDKAIPTSPTQNEVSNIFSQLSNVVKDNPEPYTRNSIFFDVKEVSTHFPILGRPSYLPVTEPSEETSGKSSLQPVTEELEKTTDQQTTEQPVRIASHRRRRPTLPRTTTPAEIPTDLVNESVETTTQQHIESMEVETERPHRTRRPLRPRPGNSEEGHHQSHRIRERHRKRPTHGDIRNGSHRKRVRPHRYESEEYTTNRPLDESRDEATEVLPIIHHFTTQSFKVFEDNQKESEETQTEAHTERVNTRRRPYHRQQPHREISNDNDDTTGEGNDYTERTTESSQSGYISSYENASQEDDVPVQNHESFKVPEEETHINEIRNHNYETTTTEVLTTSKLINIPENEVEYSTPAQSILEENAWTEEIPRITTTPEPTTTTTTAPTKSNRRRPIKYNASSRPRFSVKDYRQRLNQYSSTSTTSTEPPKQVNDSNVRLRFPTRLRRPLSTTSTTTQVYEETTRSRFVPKEPRFSSPQTNTNEVITEKTIKAVNTRLRPFGRMKSTTEATVSTAKISIKPNLFNRRRPALNPLKTRISNTNQANDSDSKTDIPIEANDQYETTTANTESHSVLNVDENIRSEDKNNADRKEEEEATTFFPKIDILKNDAFEYSQRVSDLTSSMKGEYDNFKAVPSSSRRVPNHYTISTEDPVLPLEAFFSNINDRADRGK